MSGMQCSVCHCEISGLDAAYSVRKIVAFYELLRLTPAAIAPIVEREGPLCQKCLSDWESGTTGQFPATD
jgi:hypothetical protein